MISEAPNINHLWALLIVEEFVRWNVDHFFIAPGSRSTPFTTSIARHSSARSIVHYDERGLSFAALACAKATNKPCVWVTTSGSAVAHGLPAVIEASVSGIPMILLTADRPPELRQTGANQTVEQVGLFEPYVKWQIDGVPPSLDVSPSYVLTTIDQAIHRACSGHNGPVHINWMFREPLAPTPAHENFSEYLSELKYWLDSTARYTHYPTSNTILDQSRVESLAREWESIDNGFVIAGRLDNREESEAVAQLSSKLSWPLFADIGSQLRLGYKKNVNQASYVHDFFFKNVGLSEPLAPRVILQFGKRCVSKRLLHWIDKIKPQQYILVDRYPDRIDPLHHVTHRFEADILHFCSSLSNVISSKISPGSSFHEYWSRSNTTLWEGIDHIWKNTSELSEPFIARLISEKIGEGHGLVLGNSMPVRDMDMYGAYDGNRVRIMSNRGASGIDGTVATAAGFAHGIQNPVTLLIGDLAFLHDLNSLALLNRVNAPVVIVVLNNNGGGIFSFLPISESKDVFEEYFGTPHGLNFRSAAELFDIAYYNPVDKTSFLKTYERAMLATGPSLIEINTDRNENYRLHQDIESFIDQWAGQ